ncbi:MAG: hypothetical protein NWF09_08025 [Candidatus Bathyarchaeota archaeon]|nr:hypothetical protein [Candidatus Bathyarchaeota archaeon]
MEKRGLLPLKGGFWVVDVLGEQVEGFVLEGCLCESACNSG